MTSPRRYRARRADPARRAAYDALRAVESKGAYANLVIADILGERRIAGRDAAFATELLNGTARLAGTYDQIIVQASGRSDLQANVRDVLRLGTHQLLSMRVPTHAAIAETVDLAGAAIGERVTGLVNAVLRKVSARSLDAWLDDLSSGLSTEDALALRGHHPRWIADAFVDLLGPAEAADAMAANNENPVTAAAVRPGLADVAELAERTERGEEGGTPLRWSPYGAAITGFPGDLAAIREGRAGVQDEGSQLVALAFSRAARTVAPAGPWLDLCAGPGGKAALLAGLAHEAGTTLTALERAPHRAELVRQAVRAYPFAVPVVVADGRTPPFPPASFAAVLADVPCTGLGALRRRPEARWRRSPDDLDELLDLQRGLLSSALELTRPGGVVGYATCSPHRAETAGVVTDVLAGRDDVEILDAPQVLAEVPGTPAATDERFVQLWPHRHGTDAMFLALLRRRPAAPDEAPTR